MTNIWRNYGERKTMTEKEYKKLAKEYAEEMQSMADDMMAGLDEACEEKSWLSHKEDYFLIISHNKSMFVLFKPFIERLGPLSHTYSLDEDQSQFSMLLKLQVETLPSGIFQCDGESGDISDELAATTVESLQAFSSEKNKEIVKRVLKENKDAFYKALTKVADRYIDADNIVIPLWRFAEETLVEMGEIDKADSFLAVTGGTND